MESNRKGVVKRIRNGYAKVLDAVERVANDKESQMKERVALLQGASPLKIISSGYAKIYSSSKPISGVSQLKQGNEIAVYMQDGKANALVTGVEKKGE